MEVEGLGGRLTGAGLREYPTEGGGREGVALNVAERRPGPGVAGDHASVVVFDDHAERERLERLEDPGEVALGRGREIHRVIAEVRLAMSSWESHAHDSTVPAAVGGGSRADRSSVVHAYAISSTRRCQAAVLASRIVMTSMHRTNTRWRLLALLVAVTVLVAACGGGDDGGSGSGSGQDLSGRITIDGSSTVAPLSEAAAELFQEENGGVQVTVGTSGTGGGFEKFCNGETDISDASRKIKQSEVDACNAKGIKYEELTIALDGLSVIVSPQNTWAKCLTVEQLKKIWAPGSTVSNWRQVDPSFPDEKLSLFGAGTDSGTFDYFTEAINGREGESRTDYQATEDDNVTVNGVAGTEGGLGYLGLSYVEQNQGKIKAVQVNGGSGCVEASTESVQDGTYKPLGRPLFIYPKADAMKRPEVAAFLQYYIDNALDIAEQAQFVPLTSAQQSEARTKVERLIGASPQS